MILLAKQIKKKNESNNNKSGKIKAENHIER